MKVITIKQPWASLIALGEKEFETRSWQTKYRGSLAIHAGKSVDKEACESEPIKRTLNKHGITSYKQLPIGCVIATTELVDCHRVLTELGHAAITFEKTIEGDEFKFGNYEEGRFAWQLANLQVLPEPVQAKGQLGLWKWNKE